MNAFPWETFVRALLKFGGGFFVNKGITDNSTVETIAAGVATLVGLAWGWARERYYRRKMRLLDEEIGPEI